MAVEYLMIADVVLWLYSVEMGLDGNGNGGRLLSFDKLRSPFSTSVKKIKASCPQLSDIFKGIQMIDSQNDIIVADFTASSEPIHTLLKICGQSANSIFTNFQ